MTLKTLPITITFLFLSTLVVGQEGIAFQDIGLEEAMALAKTENKLVFVDGFATWCGPCKRMDAETFTDAEIGNLFNSTFVSVKLDMEKGEGLEVAERYRIKAFPTFLYLDTLGNVLHKGAGFFNVAEFMALTQVSADSVNRLGTLQARYDAGERDSSMLAILLAQKFDLLDPSYIDVAEALADTYENWEHAEVKELIFDYTNSTSSRFFKYLVENKKDFYDAFGEGVTYGKIEKLVRDRSFEVESTTIEEMEGLFQMVYPKHAEEIASKYRMTYYRQKGDRKNYAQSAIDHYKEYPSRDPEELNEVGETFSRVIEDQILLRKVIPLVQKSIKIDSQHYNNDTLAAILFKLGQIEKAKAAAEKAIAIGQASGVDTSYTDELLEVIKSHLSN